MCDIVVKFTFVDVAIEAENKSFFLFYFFLFINCYKFILFCINVMYHF